MVGVEEGADLRFRPVMVPEVGDHVEIRDLLYRGTRFHVRIEGRGAKLLRAQVDGEEFKEAVVPVRYYDGKRHMVTLRMQQS